MRVVLAIFSICVLLSGPANELLHGHDLGSSDPDCLACQADSSPGEILAPVVAAPETAAHAPAPPRPCLRVLRLFDPLRRAPKTSPPIV